MLHVMLPVQYLRRADQKLAEPQKRLMLAVLQTVLDDCEGSMAPRPAGQDLPIDRRAYLEAKAYLESPDRSWPFSFENICEAVGLDANGIRRGLGARPVRDTQ
jgi:hypothetical protein